MDTYTVRAGDTLNFIAYKHNTTVQKLIELNPNLKDNFLYLGQTIRIITNNYPAPVSFLWLWSGIFLFLHNKSCKKRV